MPSPSIEVRKLILYHYRRSQIGEVESDTIEFSCILEKDGRQVRVGQHYTDGTFQKPREIFKLLESGWKLILVESSYKWNWHSRRYVSESNSDFRKDDQDVYGRWFKEDLWCGWYDKVDVIGDRRHEEKLFHNADTDKEITKFGIPEDIKQLIEKTEWMSDALCLAVTNSNTR